MDSINHLNEQQQAAVTVGDGPVLVLAGPGSGKTRVLTHRIAYLIQERHVYPNRIIAVTFTNRAAEEMHERIDALTHVSLKGMRVGTFHALCARILRQEVGKSVEEGMLPYTPNYVIYDTTDQASLMKQIVDEMGMDLKDLNLGNPSRVLNHISSAKNELISPQDYPATDNPTDQAIAKLYDVYQRRLIANNAMDFDDLLMQTVYLMEADVKVRERYQHYFHYVLVDEFQDTNLAQYQLVHSWSAPQNNVFVVGDEDQAIYRFRGADYRNVLRFREDFAHARTILLEQNYRSTQIILDGARAVIDHNINRTPKNLFTQRQGSQKIYVYEARDHYDEAHFIIEEIQRLCARDSSLSLRDIAIMYRVNAQSRIFEQFLTENHIVYRLYGGIAFYQRREIKDLLAYLRLIISHTDTISLERAINTPKRGIGQKTITALKDWAESHSHVLW